MKVSIITAVCDRPRGSFNVDPHFEQCIKSVVSQPGWNWEWLVGLDGFNPGSQGLLRQYQRPQILPIEVSPANQCTWGNRQKNELMHRATGDLLLFLDQDDVLEPTAVTDVLMATSEKTLIPTFYRVEIAGQNLGWGEVKMSKVSGSQFVVPNAPEKLGSWTPEIAYAADFNFIQSTLRKWNGQHRWVDITIVKAPEGLRGQRAS